MKKYAVISLVIIMLAISVVPAFARSGPPDSRGAGNGICAGNQNGMQSPNAQAGYQHGFGVQASYYALSGTISAVDGSAHTITVTIACGNKLVSPYISQSVILQTTTTTRFLLRNDKDTATVIYFDDLSAGQNISSRGSLVDGTWTAVRITSGALLTCLP